jgi:hypothetical protein
MYKLKRTRDGAGQVGRYSNAIRWNEDDTFKEVDGDRPKVGCSMLVFQSMMSDWLTTVVTEILEDTPNYVRFKTKNSEYEWTILPDQEPSNAPLERMMVLETSDV